MKKNIFAANGLPFDLSDAAKRGLAGVSEKELLAKILTNVAFAGRVTGVAIAVTLSLDTSAYTAGDVLADTQAVAGALRSEGEASVLHSLSLLDKDDQTAAGIDLVFLSANVSLGAENSAPSITDANAEKILGIVSLGSGDFIDVGGAKVATKTGINLQLTADSGTTVYVAAIARGTPTQTAEGIVLNLGVRFD